MDDRKIKVTISALGIPKIEAIGFGGEGCAAATKNIEDVLSGGGETTRVLKPEWSESEGPNQQHQELRW